MKSTGAKKGKKTCFRPRSISDLPENVLVHIISFLPIKDAIATSFLSKSWRNLWTHSPSLIFRYDRILPGDNDSDDRNDESDDQDDDLDDQDDDLDDAEKARIFASFVDQALQRYHHDSLRSLSIAFGYDDSIVRQVDNWVQIAAGNNKIRNLYLDFWGYGWDWNIGDPLYLFSLPLFTSSSLTTLSLHQCKLIPSSEPILRFLRTLHLDGVNLTDEIIPELIAGSPELENLTLEYCDGMNVLNISSTSLKNLSLHDCGHRDTCFEINTPNLISLDCVDGCVDNYSFRDLSSLVNARLIFYHSPRYNKTSGFNKHYNVAEALAPAKKLTLQNCWGEHLLWKIRDQQKIVTYNVQYLELRTSFSKFKFLGLALILDHSPNLGTVVIRQSPWGEKEDGKFESEVLESYSISNLPQLKIFKIYSYGAKEKEIELEIELVKLLLKHGIELKEMILTCWKESYSLILKKHSEELQNFPRSSKHAKIFIVDM